MTERWAVLFKKALKILEKAGISREEWSFGGGSALTMYYKHRESFDIDIFLSDVQYLLLLTPRLNYISDIRDYTEMSNFVKLKMEEGEIDFILAPHLTKDWYVLKELYSEVVQIETPWEIIVKKLFYRPESLKIRDIIDTAIVLKNERRKMREQRHILVPKYDILNARWGKLKELYKTEVGNLIIYDKEIAEIAPVIFNDFLLEIRASY
ncbi:hypothetical protein H0A61_00341 [Koleobacter methoxysyntrophicus]|jgi:hypothetical protein|uniref:Nucleotidyl transferase AbiEii toxin, Type IV TA system n=1 Tax=Koleobacter methoxysyntrophicus TaxID=2751313 RepID=A0A8A0RJF3_9FIRM|nr:nucleotidyl transferase AbiEii/AbiGii toxin family protein [Koleobacter methoxysyntrophicus]QSQ08022.1 hypothetical protein H0A61_00341 [Koleobacter methoxysyntrophicus]